MKYKPDGKNFAKTQRSALIFISVLGALSLSIFFIFPEQKVTPFDIPVAKNERPKIQAEFNTPLSDKPAAVRHGDEGLTLYRQPYYRLAVEDFYISETNNRSITLAILEFADKTTFRCHSRFRLRIRKAATIYAQSTTIRTVRSTAVSSSSMTARSRSSTKKIFLTPQSVRATEWRTCAFASISPETSSPRSQCTTRAPTECAQTARRSRR